MKKIKLLSLVFLCASMGYLTGCGEAQPTPLPTPKPTPDPTAANAKITASKNSVTVEKTDVPVEFTVALTKAMDKDVTVTVESASDLADSHTLNNGSVVIAKGQTSAKGTVTMKSSAFPDDNAKAKVTLTIKSDDVTVAEADKKAEIEVAGTAQAFSVRLKAEPANVTIVDEDKTSTLTIELYEPADRNITFLLNASSDHDDKYVFTDEILVLEKGNTSVTGSILFRAADFAEATDNVTVTITMTSDDIEIPENNSKVTVKCQAKQPFDSQLSFESDYYEVQVSNNGFKSQFNFLLLQENGGTAAVPGKNYVDYTVTGKGFEAIEGVHYDWMTTAGPRPPRLIENATPQGWFEMFWYDEAAGKTFIIEIKTDDFTKGMFPSAEFEVVEVEWPPLIRESPHRNPIAFTWNNFGPVILSLKVNGSQNYSYDFSAMRRDYMDYYDETSFNLIRGQENTITLTVLATYEYDVKNNSIMIYADFNNNGSFADPGEEIVCEYIGDQLTTGRSKSIDVKFNVPADAAAVFPIRIGSFHREEWNGDYGKDVKNYIRNGYSAAPMMYNLIQICDFKIILQ